MAIEEYEDLIGDDLTPVRPAIDLDEARRFLELLAPGEPVTFQTFDDGPAKRKRLVKVRHGSFDRHRNELEQLNQQGAGVFVTVNATNGRRTAADVLGVRALFVDIDKPAPGTLERLRAAKLPPSMIVESSPGKLHAYWLTNAMELSEFSALQARLIAAWGGDAACKDASRVLRIPGFLHLKNPSDPQLPRILEAPGHRYGRELVEWVGRIGPGTASDSAANDDDATADLLALVPDRVDAAMAALCAGDGVHENALIVVGSMVREGATDARIRAWFKHAIALHVEAARGADRAAELMGGELDRMIAGARAKFTPAATRTQFDFVQASEMVVKPVSWLVRGYLETDTLAMLYGPPGKGKSFIALDICCCVAAGVQFHGHEVEQGAVFYIAGEGHNGIARRVRAWVEHRGLTGTPDALFVSSAPVDLANAINATAVAEAVDQLATKAGVSPALIVVDTMARNFLGDENSSQDVGRFVANLDALRRRWNATVLVVHHTGKDADKGARGSSALKAAVDAEYEVSRQDADKLVRLVARKMKDAEEPTPLAFHLVTVPVENSAGGAESSAVLALADYTEPSEPDAGGLGKNQSLALVVLAGLSQPVTVDAWREGCAKAGMTRQRFHETRASLEKRGLVMVRGGVVEIDAV